MDTMIKAWEPRILSIMRIAIGLDFLQHGMSKLFDFPHVDRPGQVPLMSLLGLAGVLELAGGVLLTLGLYTRLVAFIVSGEMAAAYFMAHAPAGFFPILNHGELAVVYCFVFFYLAFAGGGEWSLDQAMRGEKALAAAR
jgi:putative oxidoreductase